MILAQGLVVSPPKMGKRRGKEKKRERGGRKEEKKGKRGGRKEEEWEWRRRGGERGKEGEMKKGC